MATIADLPREKAKFNPGAVFDTPNDVVGEILMTRGEKIATLKRWREDVLSQLRAGDEGMSTRRTSAAHADMLKDIEIALAALQTDGAA
jgi:hypothetical protein